MANTHATSKRKVTVDDNGNRERPQKKSNQRMTAVLPERQVTPRMEDRDVEAIPMYVEELLLLLTCYVEGTS